MSDNHTKTNTAAACPPESALLEREKPFKWGWMMRYCKLHGLPPAKKWAWDRAEKAFIHAHGDQ